MYGGQTKLMAKGSNGAFQSVSRLQSHRDSISRKWKWACRNTSQSARRAGQRCDLDLPQAATREFSVGELAYMRPGLSSA